MERREFVGFGIGLWATGGHRAFGAAGRRLERAAFPIAEAIYSACIGAPPGRRLPGDDPPLLRKGQLESVALRWMGGWGRVLERRIVSGDLPELERQIAGLLLKPFSKAGFRFVSGDNPVDVRSAALEARIDCRLVDGAPRKDGKVPSLIMIGLAFVPPGGTQVAGREFYSGYDLADLRELPPPKVKGD